MSKIIDFMAYKYLKKIMTPEQYAEVVGEAWQSEENWIDQPTYNTNLVLARAFKNRERRLK